MEKSTPPQTMNAPLPITAEPLSDGNIQITWAPEWANTTVSVYMGPSPDNIDRARPVAVVRGVTQVELTGLDSNRRPYFLVVPSGGPGVITAPRRILLVGAFNFRDLGGYRTTDGHQIRWGQIFRSDGLARLTDDDIETIAGLGLKTIIDFRSRDEVQATPDRLPPDGPTYLHLPIQTSELNFVTAKERMMVGDLSWLTDDYLVRGYLRNLDEWAHVWGRALTICSRAEARPLAFHCTGGKDRAGTFAAVLLLALGLPEETVIHDHQYSNICLAPFMARINGLLISWGLDPQKAAPYFSAPLAGIRKLMERLHQRYGSVQAYLTGPGGVEPAILDRLRAELLEPGPVLGLEQDSGTD